MMTTLSCTNNASNSLSCVMVQTHYGVQCNELLMVYNARWTMFNFAFVVYHFNNSCNLKFSWKHCESSTFHFSTSKPIDLIAIHFWKAPRTFCSCWSGSHNLVDTFWKKKHEQNSILMTYVWKKWTKHTTLEFYEQCFELLIVCYAKWTMLCEQCLNLHSSFSCKEFL